MKVVQSPDTYKISIISRTIGLQDTENLVTRHEANLGNTMAIPKSNTNLGGGKTLASKLGDVVNDIIRGRL